MRTRIICLEEHCVFPPLLKSAQAATARQAPYYSDLNSHYRDDAATPGDLPALRPVKDAIAIAGASVGERISAMNDHGIDMQVLSYTDVIQSLSPSDAIELAEKANDYLAEMSAHHPDHLAAFCTLPWQDVDGAICELERVATIKGICGCMVAGRPGDDLFLDDSRYGPLLKRLQDLNFPLYVHPGPPLLQVQKAYYRGFNKDVNARFSLIGWGWHSEAGVQVVRLILSGTMDRYPRLRIISGHWGEMVPFFLQRMDDTMPMQVTGLTRSISETYRNQVYVTPSGMLNDPHFQFIRTVLGCERILFSVDYPYLTMRGAERWIGSLPVSEEERALIAHGNAERLLRL